VETPLVFVGEVVTNATGVTSAIAYAYNGLYHSGFTNGLPAAGTQISKNANLGCIFRVDAKMVLECITADAGYVPGDRIAPQSGYYSRSAVARGRNTVSFNCNGWYNTNKTTGADVNLTLANWKYALIAQRMW
jgi:hypothetical protein